MTLKQRFKTLLIATVTFISGYQGTISFRDAWIQVESDTGISLSCADWRAVVTSQRFQDAGLTEAAIRFMVPKSCVTAAQVKAAVKCWRRPDGSLCRYGRLYALGIGGDQLCTPDLAVDHPFPCSSEFGPDWGEAIDDESNTEARQRLRETLKEWIVSEKE